MKRLWAALPDRYLGLAFCSWATMIPLLVSAFAHIKGTETADHWFFTVLPGVGMALGGTFGNCLVIAAALNTRIVFPRGTRAGVFLWSTLSLVATGYLLKNYLLAAYSGVLITELLSGASLDVWFYSVLMMAEGPTPCLVFLSQITQSAQVAVERSVQEAGVGIKGRILHELLHNGERTVAGLHDVDSFPTAATLGKHLKDLAKADPPQVHSVVLDGSVAAVWRIGAAP